MPTQVPTREQVPPAYRWNLDEAFPTRQAWEEELQRGEEVLARLRQRRGTLAESGTSLLHALQDLDDVHRIASRVFAYARMKRDENNADPGAQELADRALSFHVKVEADTSFVVPEVLAIAPERLESFLADTPGLEVYRHLLDDLARQRPHVRSAEVEEILALSGEMAAASDEVYSMLCDVDMEFGTVRDEHGQEIVLTHARYLRLMESPDRGVREIAMHTLYQAYRRHHHTLAALLASSVKKDVFYARARRYPSSLHAALHPTNVPVEVYRELIRTVRRHLPVLHRYLELRKRALQEIGRAHV